MIRLSPTRSVLVLVGATVLSSGCAHWTTITTAPAPPASIPAVNAQPVPLTIDSVSAVLNGNPTPTNPVFTQSYAAGLRESGLFAPVLEPQLAHQAGPDALRMAIRATEFIDSHQGAALVKVFFIGLTLYLLAPVLPLNGDMEQQVEISLALPDGRVMRYEAKTSARLSYHLFANTTLAEAELGSKVGTSNLQAILARIREDSELRRYIQDAASLAPE